jgi:hypothetical protein
MKTKLIIIKHDIFKVACVNKRLHDFNLINKCVCNILFTNEISKSIVIEKEAKYM